MALAVDLIDEVGPDGQFLDSQHTLKHFRQRWYPGLFNRQNHDNWAASGAQTLEQRAANRVEVILQEHSTEPLPKAVAKSVNQIVKRAEAKYA